MSCTFFVISVGLGNCQPLFWRGCLFSFGSAVICNRVISKLLRRFSLNFVSVSAELIVFLGEGELAFSCSTWFVSNHVLLWFENFLFQLTQCITIVVKWFDLLILLSWETSGSWRFLSFILHGVFCFGWNLRGSVVVLTDSRIGLFAPSCRRHPSSHSGRRLAPDHLCWRVAGLCRRHRPVEVFYAISSYPLPLERW